MSCVVATMYVVCELLHDLVHKTTHKVTHNTSFVVTNNNLHNQFANFSKLFTKFCELGGNFFKVLYVLVSLLHDLDLAMQSQACVRILCANSGCSLASDS